MRGVSWASRASVPPGSPHWRNRLLRCLISCPDGGVRSFSLGTVERVLDERVLLSSLAPQIRCNETVVFSNESRALVLETLNPKKHPSPAAFLSGAPLRAGLAIESTESTIVHCSSDLIGRVVDGLGRPIDSPVDHSKMKPSLHRVADWTRPGLVLTGFSVLDSFLPVIEGESTVISGERGLDKATLLYNTVRGFLKQAMLKSADKPSVAVVVVNSSSQQHVDQVLRYLKSWNLLESCIVVCSSERESLGQQYLAPFTGAHLASHLAAEGYRAAFVMDSFSKHFDVARRVYGISWDNVAATPTRHAEMLDLPGLFTSSLESSLHRGGKGDIRGSLTVIGTTDLPPSGDASITVDNVKQRGHAAQLASLAFQEIPLSAAEARQSAFLPVSLSRILSNSSHVGQGSALRFLSFATRHLVQMAQETVALACLAQEYGIEPEADDDVVLDFNTKARLLLTPSRTGLERAARTRGLVGSINLGLHLARVSGAIDKGLTTGASSEESEKGSAGSGLGKSRLSGPFREMPVGSAQEELQRLLEQRQQNREEKRRQTRTFTGQEESHDKTPFTPKSSTVYSGHLGSSFVSLFVLVGGLLKDVPVNRLWEYLDGAHVVLTSLPPTSSSSSSVCLLEEALKEELGQLSSMDVRVDLQRVFHPRLREFMGLSPERVPSSWRACYGALRRYTAAFVRTSRRADSRHQKTDRR